MLVTVKAYPQPSRSYGETVCVAGLRVDTEPCRWIRLYPINYREIDYIDRFNKYQIVDLEVFKAPADTRPESFKPNLPSARLGELLSTSNGWRERWNALESLAGDATTCRLLHEQGTPLARSLAMVKPAEVLDLIVEPNSDFSRDRQQLANIAAQGNLFSSARTALEPAPYRLKYHYRCQESGCRTHKQTLVDWEAGQAARSWREKYPESELPSRLRDKFLGDLCADGRDTYFFLGNQHLHRKSFLVLGVFWPPKDSRPAPTLF